MDIATAVSAAVRLRIALARAQQSADAGVPDAVDACVADAVAELDSIRAALDTVRKGRRRVPSVPKDTDPEAA